MGGGARGAGSVVALHDAAVLVDVDHRLDNVAPAVDSAGTVMASPPLHRRARWRDRLYEIIFESDTPAGRLFDEVLLVAILLSVLAVMLESVPEVRAEWGGTLRAAEWTFTVLFSVEYVLRLISARNPRRYAGSFFGIVDLLAILPSYVGLVAPETQALIVIRAIRLLRVFRILKLVRYLNEAEVLLTALRASRRKITVFFGGVLTLMLIIGTLMYLIEGEESGFTSIPTAMYWAVVTITTVGYGDIVPKTLAGKALAAVAMLLGYSIIAVPTSIVSVELAQAGRLAAPGMRCEACGNADHDADAAYCKRCGAAGLWMARDRSVSGS
jgi:voltage-gated potassium channel